MIGDQARSPRAQEMRAVAVLHILLPLAFLALIAIVLFPVFAQGGSKGGQCLSNFKQVCFAAIMYSGDFDDRMPPAPNWADVTVPNTKYLEVFECRNLTETSNRYGHAYHRSLSCASIFGYAPERQVAFFESSQPGWNTNGYLDSLAPPRKPDTKNPVAFLDCHVSRLTLKELSRRATLSQ
jgi:hypothetical protein